MECCNTTVLKVVFGIYVCLLLIYNSIQVPFEINQNLSANGANFTNITITPTRRPKSISDINNFNTELLELSKKSFGDISFLENEAFPHEIKSFNSSHCKLCYNFSKFDDGDSTVDDIIIGTLFGEELYNAVQLPMMLRSVGSNCSIVYFITRKLYKILPKNISESLRNCGVTMIVLPKIVTESNVIPKLQRHILFYLFINKFKKEFNRVICLDVYDTFFQKDPFWSGFERDKVVFSKEGKTFEKNEPNREWMSKLTKWGDNRHYMKEIIICSGVFRGVPEQIIEFYHDFIDLEFWKKSFNKARDQGLLNYMYYNNKLKNVAIDNDLTFVSATGFKFDNAPYNMISLNETVPRMIHQFDRICIILEKVEDNCIIPVTDELYHIRKNMITQYCFHTSKYVGYGFNSLAD